MDNLGFYSLENEAIVFYDEVKDFLQVSTSSSFVGTLIN
jgi:hypothetical protein